jgi:ABC-type cobalamin transport system permease subunit
LKRHLYIHFIWLIQAFPLYCAGKSKKRAIIAGVAAGGGFFLLTAGIIAIFVIRKRRLRPGSANARLQLRGARGSNGWFQ